MTKSKNLHLTISAILIIIIALVYGLFPNGIPGKLFDFKAETIDQKQVFRALMGLYSSMALVWLRGTFNAGFWRIATISNVYFMLGLGSGRLISLIADGIPSPVFTIGLVVEIILGIWGLNNLKRYKEITNE